MRNAFACSRRAFVAGLIEAAVAGPLGAEELPKVTVAKDPSCDCCSGWMDYLKQAGFPVVVVAIAEINRVKRARACRGRSRPATPPRPAATWLRGDVPAPAITRLLAEKSQATELAVLGMPV